MDILNELTYINKSSLGLGFFDGLHQGHKIVIKNTVDSAKKLNIPSVIVMFKEHPQSILFNKNVEYLLTLDEKLEMLSNYDVDKVLLLNFFDYRNYTAENYIENVLVKYLNPKVITTGYNHTFGFNKLGNSSLLSNKAQKYGYKYNLIQPYCIDNIVVSSSKIRELLKKSDIKEANKLLGYSFFIKGKVIYGEKLAGKLGFPSANIDYPISKINLPYGVYCVSVCINNKSYKGVYNWGEVKDVNGNTKLKSEVHIIDFNEDIYSQLIKISFLSKIRNIINFNSISELKNQIMKDVSYVNEYMSI